MQAEYETIKNRQNDSVIYSSFPKTGRIDSKFIFEFLELLLPLKILELLFSNHHWSLEQASTLLNGDNLITLEGKYTGHEHHASFQKPR